METGGAPTPGNEWLVEAKESEVPQPRQNQASGGEFTPAPRPMANGGKPKSAKRKRTMSGVEIGRVPVDMGAGGRSGGGKRERSATVTSATVEQPMLMYPVYDSGSGALVTGTGKVAREKEGGSRGSSPRMQSAQICQRVLNHLMCDGALSLDELTTVIPEVTKENLMAVLEILDVLGVVMCMKCKQAPSVAGASGIKRNGDDKDTSHDSTALTSSSSTVPAKTGAAPKISLLSQVLAHRHTNDTYYAIVGFAKGTEFTQFTNLKEQLIAKRGNIHKIHSRVQALDELTRAKQPHTRVERVQAFKRLLDEISPTVQDDQLYRAILEQPGISSANKR